MQTLGERLRIAREAFGQNKEQVTKALGINNLGRYETNERKPGIERTVELAQYYGVSIDWMITGNGHMVVSLEATPNLPILTLSDEDIVDYKKQVLQVDYDREGNRFKIARELAGFGIEEAAAKSYMKVDDLQRLEENNHFSTETADLQQLACLAYVYEVDLYWLFCGKARPPAPIVKDGTKFYPPYEFMLEQLKATAGGTTQPTTARTLTEDEIDLLDTYSHMDADMKKATHTLMQFQLYTGTNLSYSSGSARGDKKGKLA